MNEPLTGLMRALERGIVADTASADALFLIAEEADRMGQAGVAGAIRTTARMHRAKVIEHQARLAALDGERAYRRTLDPSDQ